MDVWVVATSSAAYAEPLARLRRSLSDAGWPDDRVVVARDGAEATTVARRDDGGLDVGLAWGMYEMNAFVAAAALLARDARFERAAFVLLHDTSVVGPRFPELARAAAGRMRAEGADVLWLSPGGRCNLCAFAPRAARAAVRAWSGVRRVDKARAIRMEWGDDAASPKRLPGLRQAFARDAPERDVGEHVVYAGGHRRRVLWFPAIDVAKSFVFVDLAAGAAHPERP